MTAEPTDGDAGNGPSDVNPYIRRMSSDNDQCVPAIEGAAIPRILAAIDAQVREKLGDGPKPQVSLDLEQIQIADMARSKGSRMNSAT